MEAENGSRRQAAMQQPPAAEEAEWSWGQIVRGQVTGVRYSDQGPLRRTVVDCYVMDRTGRKTERGVLYGVPLAHSKINRTDGEEWTPEVGDFVILGFFHGNLRDPVVLGYLAPPDNGVQATSGEAPRYHRRRSGTYEKLEKDGTRRVHVAKDEILEVVGEGQVDIGGNLSVTVGGNVTINVGGNADITVAGDTTVTTPNATVHAATQVQLDTPLTVCTGNLNVNGGITCLGNYGSSGGKITTPGDIKSTGGQVGDSVRNISQDRAIYNGHTHPGDSGGTTGGPSQQQ